MRKFIVCTKDHSGLGWAVRLKDEGHEVLLAYENEDLKPGESRPYNLVGKGLVEKIPMSDLMASRKKYKDWYWIFDMNHLSEYSEQLREEKFKVFGASDFCNKMEDDRDFGVQLHKMAGLDSPPTKEFSNLEQGIKFLEQNEDKAYVFKPDASESSWLTFVPSSEKPESANKELQEYMRSVEDPGTYILQERMNGVETNFEVWFYEGTPFFAFCGLENKRKLNGDKGENVGCAFDYTFTIPLDCRAIKETVGKLFPYYKSIKYTGFGDVNVIVSDRNAYYLESCMRFGYNSHPNLLFNLLIGGVGDLLGDFIDGKIKTSQEAFKRFRYGFGASTTLYIDHERSKIPIFVPEDLWKSFFPFDLNKEKDTYFLSGYGNQCGIICGHGYTMQEAGDKCLENAEKIKYPDVAFRSDMTQKCPNSPLKRYESLKAMQWI